MSTIASRLIDPWELWARILNKARSAWLGWTYPFACPARDLQAHYSCDIRRGTAHRIALGNSVRLGRDTWLSVAVPPEQIGDPVIVIDDGCQISHRTIISAKNCIHLEKDVITAQSVLIMDHSHAYDDISAPIKCQGTNAGGRIRIGSGSWIGHGAVILCTSGELVLGRNCAVAANAVVTRSFPAFSVISGNPARVVKQYDPQKGMWMLGSCPASASESVDEGLLIGGGAGHGCRNH